MTNNAVTKEMLKNPALLSALQGKLDSMAGTTSGYIEVSYNQIFALGKGMKLPQFKHQVNVYHLSSNYISVSSSCC